MSCAEGYEIDSVLLKAKHALPVAAMYTVYRPTRVLGVIFVFHCEGNDLLEVVVALSVLLLCGKGGGT